MVVDIPAEFPTTTTTKNQSKMAHHRYEQDVYRMLRVLAGHEACRPRINQDGVCVGRAAEYFSLSDSTVIMFNASEILEDVAAETHSVPQLLEKFAERTLLSAMLSPAVKFVVLAFDRHPYSLPMDEGHVRRRNKASNVHPVGSSSAMYNMLMRDDERRTKLLGDLLEFLLHDAPLRLNLCLVISGLTNLLATAGQPVSHVPLCVKLAPIDPVDDLVVVDDNQNQNPNPAAKPKIARYQMTPGEALGADMPALPSIAAIPVDQWFLSGCRAVDHLKFWAIVFFFRPDTKKYAVVCEDPQLLLELLLIFEHYMSDPSPDESVECQAPPVLVYIHQLVAGYQVKVTSTPTNPPELDRNKPVMVPEQIDVCRMALVLSRGLGTYFKRVGLKVMHAVFLALWMRQHDFHTTTFIRPIGIIRVEDPKKPGDGFAMGNPYGYFCEFLRYAQRAEPSTLSRTMIDADHLLSPHSQLQGRQYPSMLDPWACQVNLRPLADMLVEVARPQNPGSGPWSSDSAIRGHAARVSLWLWMIMNNHLPYCSMPAPNESRVLGSPGSTSELPLYGYDKDNKPLGQMPKTDERTFYVVLSN